MDPVIYHLAYKKQIAHYKHKEADTIMLFRAVEAARRGFKKITMCNVSSDFVVLAIAHVSKLDIKKLWVVFCNTSDTHMSMG